LCCILLVLPTKIAATVATAFGSVADDSSIFITPFGVAAGAVSIHTAFDFRPMTRLFPSSTCMTTISSGRSLYSSFADDGFSALGGTPIQRPM
jgi:hypothetical protein